MSSEKSATRSYRSPLRAEQAAATRRSIVSAASAVFATRGYSGATMPQIAAAAGVSVESVHKIGKKPDLLIMAFKQTYAGESGWKTILDEPDLLRVMSMDDTDQAIAAYAEFIAAANSRSEGIWPAVRTAATTEPLVAEQIGELIALKRQDFLMGIDWYIARGIVPEATDRASVAPYLYVLTSQETYDQLTNDWGYPLDAYVEWLTQAIRKLGVSTVELPSIS